MAHELRRSRVEVLRRFSARAAAGRAGAPSGIVAGYGGIFGIPPKAPARTLYPRDALTPKNESRAPTFPEAP